MASTKKATKVPINQLNANAEAIAAFRRPRPARRRGAREPIPALDAEGPVQPQGEVYQNLRYSGKRSGDPKIHLILLARIP